MNGSFRCVLFGALCSLLLIMAPVRALIQGDRPMTNQDVIRLEKLGLSADVIINKIASSQVAFDLSMDGLTALAQNRVPNDVIKAMQARSASSPSNSKIASGQSLAGTGPSNGKPSESQPPIKAGAYPLPPDKGAYLWDGTSIHLLYQTNVPSMGEHFWRKFVPFIHQKIELQLVGPRAKAHFIDNQPTILVSGLGEIIPGIPTFRWLYVKSGGMLKDRRIVGTYEVGGFFGSIQMVDNEIECDTKKVKEGIYAITPRQFLSDGEYGLVQVPKLVDMSARTLQSFALPVWDFGIYAETVRPK